MESETLTAMIFLKFYLFTAGFLLLFSEKDCSPESFYRSICWPILTMKYALKIIFGCASNPTDTGDEDENNTLQK